MIDNRCAVDFFSLSLRLSTSFAVFFCSSYAWLANKITAILFGSISFSLWLWPNVEESTHRIFFRAPVWIDRQIIILITFTVSKWFEDHNHVKYLLLIGISSKCDNWTIQPSNWFSLAIRHSSVCIEFCFGDFFLFLFISFTYFTYIWIHKSIMIAKSVVGAARW